jgi:trafficking protein particle complex subunit 6
MVDAISRRFRTITCHGRFLAFPCGILRGALANLGIPAVVSCDFLADGQNMAACSFNIKVK